MIRMAKWEWFFILVAAFQILLAVSIQGFQETGTQPDPFSGEYMKASPIEQAVDETRKPQKISLPEPSLKDWMVGEVRLPEENRVVPSPTPTPALKQNRGETVRAFLLEPTHLAIFRKDRKEKDAFRVMFRFEVYPKEETGKIQVMKEGKAILEIPFEASADGAHRTGAMIRKPGVYQWRIVTEDHQGDFRSFTLRP